MKERCDNRSNKEEMEEGNREDKRTRKEKKKMKVEDAQEGLDEKFREDLHKKNPWVTSIPHSPSTRKTLMAATISKEDEEDRSLTAATGSEDQYFITTFMEKEDATVAALLKKQNATAAALAKEKNVAAMQSEAVACFSAAPLPNSIHHGVKFAGALLEDKDTAAVWVERKEKVAAVHEVVAETATTPRSIICAVVCLGLVDDSAAVIGSKTQHFATAAMGKNKTVAARAERLDTATNRAATSASKIVETIDVAAANFVEKKGNSCCRAAPKHKNWY
ncbi:hypothetical protein ACH5RR_025549 [Cinchona calisaya]|uniref:Uncharacterized protein n=1 Tax=Cinchona calisaya TaxID=153742 RepID=A0ABD2YZZ2_9GENT